MQKALSVYSSIVNSIIDFFLKLFGKSSSDCKFFGNKTVRKALPWVILAAFFGILVLVLKIKLGKKKQ